MTKRGGHAEGKGETFLSPSSLPKRTPEEGDREKDL